MFQRSNIHHFDARSLVLVAACVLASGATWAQDKPAAEDPAQQALVAAFTKADRNGDGKLSAEESRALPAASENFAKLDTDGDRSLSQAEFVKGLQHP